ncbi:hypothetical protein [Acinetobacter ursingii]|uniref:hypothetical protein n=1 Tax=Acinetobacter ursingii TaxID=108980 RepID=UPI003008A5F9
MVCTISELVSLLANICTVIALVLAIYLWSTWKKQQNYSFMRDKVFEAEIAVAKAYTVLMQLVEYDYNYRLQLINMSNTPPPEYYKNQRDNLNLQIENYLKEYDFAIYSLEVLGLGISKDILINYQILQNNFGNYMDQVRFKKTTEELINYFWNSAIPEMQDRKKNAMTHLSKLRKSI